MDANRDLMVFSPFFERSDVDRGGRARAGVMLIMAGSLFLFASYDLILLLPLAGLLFPGLPDSL